MSLLWLGVIVLALLGAAFLAWPLGHQLLAGKRAPTADRASAEQLQARLSANIDLFREHLAELESALTEGRIDKEQFEQLKLEQERSLLEDEEALRRSEWQSPGVANSGRNLLIATVLIVPLLGVALYTALGASDDLRLARLQQEKAQADFQDRVHGRERDPELAQRLIEQLEARVERQPDNLQYWFMLARTAMEQGAYGRAADAYREVLRLDPESARVRAELAQALFFVENNQMTGEIAELTRSALAEDPANTTALGLAGIHAFEEEDYAAAADYWQRAVDLLDPRAPGTQALRSGIERAQARLDSQPESEREVAAAPSASTGVEISLRVTLDESIEADSDQVVYVYARRHEGRPVPLAIQRLSVADLPADVVLDESMAMTPEHSLADLDESIELVARLSATGEPTPAPGDWEASLGPLDPDKLPEDIELHIEQPVRDPNPG